jgi:hypothetical protein
LTTKSTKKYLPLFRELSWNGHVAARSTLLKIANCDEYKSLHQRNADFRQHEPATGPLRRKIQYASASAHYYFPKWDDDHSNLGKAKRTDEPDEDASALLNEFKVYFLGNTPRGVYFSACLLPLKLFLLTYLDKHKYTEARKQFGLLLNILDTFKDKDDDAEPTFQHVTFLFHLLYKIGALRRKRDDIKQFYDKQWRQRQKTIKDKIKDERAKKEQATKDVATEDVATEETKEQATEEAATEDLATEDVATEEQATEEGATEDVATEETIWSVSNMLGKDRAVALQTHITTFVLGVFDNFSIPAGSFTQDKPQPEETTTKVGEWLKKKFKEDVSKQIDNFFQIHGVDSSSSVSSSSDSSFTAAAMWTPSEGWSDDANDAKQKAAKFIDIAVDYLAQTLVDHLENWRGFFEQEYLTGRDT